MSLFPIVKKDSQVGVDFLPTGVAVVQVKNTGKEYGKILHSDFLRSLGRQAQVEALQQWVIGHKLQKSPCVCLIAGRDYDINQVDRPQVDESELLQAMTWRIKDLVNYDVGSAVVDVYPMPVSSKNHNQQLSVVSAHEATIAAYVDNIQAARLKLIAIDIHALVSKNLPSVQQSQGETQAVLSLSSTAGVLNIFHDTDLYVSRDFKIGLKQLVDADSEDQSVSDLLLLEVQRSMDYFESYFGLGAVSGMLIFPQIPATEKMARYLQKLTSLVIGFVPTEGESNASDSIDSHCFHAYCAALRNSAS
ncbi:MAG: hypothetical protein GY784_10665 [Gammaproteobacteria bacterium]|nr:hypothetical protein [Gammaproteobacteria bacterium]